MAKTYYVTKWALTKGVWTIQGEVERQNKKTYIWQINVPLGSRTLFLELGKDIFETAQEASADRLARARKNVAAKERALKRARELLTTLEKMKEQQC